MKMNHRVTCATIVGAAAAALAGPARAQQLPDLYITGFQYVNGVYRGNCNTVRVNVRNSQNVGVSSRFSVQLTSIFPDGASPSRTATVNGIGPGATLPVTLTSVLWSPVLGGLADSGKTVMETNERNNGRTYNSPGPTKDCPKLSISDAQAREGDIVRFAVKLDQPFPGYVSANYATANGSASGGSCTSTSSADYQAVRRGTVRFSPNQTSATVSIRACSDTNLKEKNETFTVKLYGATNASYGRREATGTILGTLTLQR